MINRPLCVRLSPEWLERRAEIIYPECDLPSTIDYRDRYLPPRLTAGLIGVAYTCAELVECRDSLLRSYCSPQYILDQLVPRFEQEEILDHVGYTKYYNERQSEVTMYDGLNVLKNGCPQEETFLRNNSQLAIEGDKQEHKIDDFASVSTIIVAKRALMRDGPLAMIVPCYNYSNRPWVPVRSRDFSNIIGFHAMSVVGYNEEGFILRGSWGTEWGSGGYVIFPYEDWGLQSEIWTKISDFSSYQQPHPVKKDKPSRMRRLIRSLSTSPRSTSSSAAASPSNSAENTPRDE